MLTRALVALLFLIPVLGVLSAIVSLLTLVSD
jgi:hypothetical protein